MCIYSLIIHVNKILIFQSFIDQVTETQSKHILHTREASKTDYRNIKSKE